jgi:hypothetical protein
MPCGKQVAPMVSGQPGSVSGVWLEPQDGQASAIVVFESEETARAFFDMVNSAPTGPIVIQSMDVREVAAHA